MKMRIRKIISLIICICLLNNINYTPTLAEGETSPLQDVLYTYIGKRNNEYYTSDDNFAYQRSANNFESSSAMKFLYDLADVYIDIESKPNEDIYYEELLKSIMYFDSEPPREVAPDKDLGIEAIVNDCSDSLEIAAGLFKVGNVAKDITEMVGSISDAANLATEVGTEMGDLLQYLTHSYDTYAKFTMLLDGVAENAYNDELRKAAEQLREDIDTSFIYKLSQSEQLLNIGENVTEYTFNSNFGNDYFDVSFVEYLDDIDTYIEDANFQSFLKLSSELAMTAITDLTSLGTGFDIGEFIANKIVSFDGLNEKRLEIIAIADISNAAKTFMLDEQLKFLNERDVETANERAVDYIEASIYLVNIHIQGEYSWLELVETDEGILWGLKKVIAELFQEDLVNEEWYRSVTGALVEHKTTLKYMLEERSGSNTSMSNEDGITIYEEVIERYKAVNSGEIAPEDYEQYDINGEIGYSIQEQDAGLSYVLHDVDGNGTDELFIGINGLIFEAFGYNGEEAVKLFVDESGYSLWFGYRTSLEITDNQTFIISGSGGATVQGIDIYQMGDNGYEPKLLESYLHDGGYYTVEKDGVITDISEAEWNVKLEEYNNGIAESFEWISLDN